MTTTTPVPATAPGSARRVEDGLPNVAAITMCRDEGSMLPRWVQHYGTQVGFDNLVVVDDNSTDGSTDGLPCSVIRIPHIKKKAFEPTRMGVLSGLAQSLLEVYDAVIATDTDEFIVPDPARYESIRHFVAAREGATALGVVALNVIHHVGVEPPLDPARPILGQRQYAKFLPLMCKPSLKWVAAPWAAASHGIKAPFTVDPELWMFHMKFADRDHLQAAADHRRMMVEMDGRAASTNWQHGGDNLVALLDGIWEGADPATIENFRVPRGRLPDIVHAFPNGVFRAKGRRQVKAMEDNPIHRIPRRFWGIV